MSDEELDALVIIRAEKRRALHQAREALDAAEKAFKHADDQVMKALEKR